MQTNKSSMAFDVQYKRKTEIDFISGAVSKIGKKHGGLGNIYYTDGKQGKVIKIKIKGRNGEQGSLPQAMRSSLSKNLKIKDNEHLSLAGVFRVLNGKIRSHVHV